LSEKLSSFERLAQEIEDELDGPELVFASPIEPTLILSSAEIEQLRGLQASVLRDPPREIETHRVAVATANGEPVWGQAAGVVTKSVDIAWLGAGGRIAFAIVRSPQFGLCRCLGAQASPERALAPDALWPVAATLFGFVGGVGHCNVLVSDSDGMITTTIAQPVMAGSASIH